MSGSGLGRTEKYNGYGYTAGDPTNRTDVSGCFTDRCTHALWDFGIYGVLLIGSVVAAILSDGILAPALAALGLAATPYMIGRLSDECANG